jgi:hypothetical protein
MRRRISLHVGREAWQSPTDDVRGSFIRAVFTEHTHSEKDPARRPYKQAAAAAA